MRKKKVFVTGCFDMLHSGHIRFLQEAAGYGELHVGLGSDQTVKELKGRYPVNNQTERKYMIEALRCVKACLINSGSGTMDFLRELRKVRPDVFVVNEEGNVPAKFELCKRMGIRYLVLKRTPEKGLPPRSTTTLRRECRIPYRLDLAGGWLDQPFVSKHAAGPVITISVEPTVEFNERSGMASSSRRRAIELWQADIPAGDREKLAKTLFYWENPPGTEYFSGSQDAIGIVFPGLNRLEYDGNFWPKRITSIQDPEVLGWLEKHLQLIPMGPRRSDFRVLDGTRITALRARKLAAAAERCWEAIEARNASACGRHMQEAFEAQVAMFPNMMNDEVGRAIRKYASRGLGFKVSGAGGGGYLVIVARVEIPGAMRIKIRRPGP